MRPAIPTIVGTHHEACSSSDDGGRVDWVSCRGKVPPCYVNPPRMRVSTEVTEVQYWCQE